MISGIASGEYFSEHCIPVIQNLRDNRKDHIGRWVTFLVHEEIALVKSRLYNISNVLEYVILGEGLWTNVGNIEGIAFINTKYANASDDFPDIQLLYYSSGQNNDIIRETRGLTREFYYAVYGEFHVKDLWNPYSTLLRLKSRNVIKLRSKNPFDYLLIYPNYFKEPEDMVTSIEGVKFVLEMSKTASCKRYGNKMNPKPFPCSKRIPMYTDPYWRDMIKLYLSTIFHFV